MTELKAQVPDSYMQGYDGFEKEWLSCSALALLQMCGKAFEFKYIDRIREPVSIRMVAGSAAHKGREHNLVQKVTSEVDHLRPPVFFAVSDPICQAVLR